MPGDAEEDVLELAVFTGETETVHALVPGSSLVVGRAPGSEIFIDDASVSRRHAILSVTDVVCVEGLGGPNGVTLREAGASTEDGKTPAQTLSRPRARGRKGHVHT